MSQPMAHLSHSQQVYSLEHVLNGIYLDLQILFIRQHVAWPQLASHADSIDLPY